MRKLIWKLRVYRAFRIMGYRKAIARHCTGYMVTVYFNEGYSPIEAIVQYCRG